MIIVRVVAVVVDSTQLSAVVSVYELALLKLIHFFVYQHCLSVEGNPATCLANKKGSTLRCCQVDHTKKNDHKYQ